MPSKAKPKLEPVQPVAVVPLGTWLRDGQTVDPAPRWDFKADRSVYGKAVVRHALVGAVSIKSGAIAAGDPLVVNAKSYTRKVKPGSYPVVLSKLEYAKRDTVAVAATVVLRSGVLERFELARANAKERYFQSYAVDSATGSFHDPKSLPLIKRYQDEHGQEALQELLAPGAVLVLDKKAGLNVVGFSTGSDGAFYSYWGLDPKGEVLCLTTDFGAIDSFESLDVFRSYRLFDVQLQRSAKSS